MQKIGEGEVSEGPRTKLEHDLDHMQHLLNDALDLHLNCTQNYTDSMLKSLNQNEYFSRDDFMTIHRNMKNEIITKVTNYYFESSCLNTKSEIPLEY